MQSEEQQLIDNLFIRLRQAEAHSTPRDAAAEKRIADHLQQQPGAPYYMAQAILIQEAAMKKLNDRVNDLEKQQAQQQSRSSGGFLSGLFGGTDRQSAPVQQTGWNSTPSSQHPLNTTPSVSGRSTGFLGGALQTAAGVAGGVVIANMLTSMFQHSQPQEIVNTMNETSGPEATNASQHRFNQPEENAFPEQNRWPIDSGSDYDNDSFENDDDSFI